MSRLLSSLAASLVAFVASACCAGGTCIKEPPCRACENPCCLSPLQKVALEKKTHALIGGPTVYTFDEKTYMLFTEKGLKDFEKDPSAFEEKGATRLIRGGKTWRVDMNPGDEVILADYAGLARPFVPAPAAAK
jgi:hypothetical protein